MRILSNQTEVTVNTKLTVSPKPSGYILLEAFPFNLLPKATQEEIYRKDNGERSYPWNNENVEAIDSFLFEIGCKLSDYSYDEYSSNYKIRPSNEIFYESLIDSFSENPIEAILEAFSKRYSVESEDSVSINTEALSSGFYIEDTCFSHVDEIVKKYNDLSKKDFLIFIGETTFEDVIFAAIDKAFESMKKDFENFYSFDYFKDEMESNDLHFTWEGDYIGTSDLLVKVEENKLNPNSITSNFI